MHLAAVPLPVDGEALDGYLDRVSALHGVTLSALLEHLDPRRQVNVTMVAIKIQPQWGQFLDQSFGLDDGTTERMTLAHRYRDQLPSLGRARTPHEITLASARDWFFLAGSRYCPKCLRETGVWKLAWRIPLSIACLEHGTLLVDRCPECLGWPRSASDGKSSPRALWNEIRDPRRCTCSEAVVTRRHGRAGVPCNADLTTALASASNQLVLRHQSRIDEALQGQAVDIAGRARSPRGVLTGVRELVTLYARMSMASEHGVRRLWRTPPRDLTSLVPSVEATATVVDAAEPRSAAQTLAEIAARQSIDLNSNFYRDNLGRDPVLAEVYDTTLTLAGRYTTKLRRLRHASQESLRLYEYDGSAVPQLVPTCALPELLIKRSGRPGRHLIRAVICLSLVRLVIADDANVERCLDFPPGSARQWTR